MRKLSVVAILFLLAMTSSAAAKMEGMAGGGIGGANSGGGAGLGVGIQMLTLNGIVMVAPNPWLVFIGDLSIGFSPTYESADAGGDVDEVDASAFFIDGLVGLYQHFAQDAYLYGGLGLTIGAADMEIKERSGGSVETTEGDFDTSIGLVFGAGVGFPIVEKVLGFVSIRQRFVKSEADFTSDVSGLVRVAEVPIGGMEMSAGIGVGF